MKEFDPQNVLRPKVNAYLNYNLRYVLPCLVETSYLQLYRSGEENSHRIRADQEKEAHIITVEHISKSHFS